MTTYHVEVDVVRDGRPYIHSIDNVTAANAQAARCEWDDRAGEGFGFVDNATGVSWFYFWHEIRDLRIIAEPCEASR